MEKAHPVEPPGSAQRVVYLNVKQLAGGKGGGCHGQAAVAPCSNSGSAGGADAWVDAMQLYRFPLALAVVMVHSGYLVLAQAAAAESAAHAGGPGLWIVRFLTLISLPATSSFLVFAGFLFFREGPVSLAEYQRKLRCRFYTLLVPYLAWNFIAVLLLCAPPAGKYFLLGPKDVTFSPLNLEALGRWFAGWPIYPADAPLWFVRDLLFLVVVAPLFAMIPNWARRLCLATLFCYWLRGPWEIVPGGIPRAFSVFFFSVGAWMGINRTRIEPGRVTDSVMIAAALVLVIAGALGASLGSLDTHRSTVAILMEKIIRVSGTVLVVCATARTALAGSSPAFLLRFSRVSFFLFACHFCVLTCISVLFKHLPPDALGLGRGLFLLVVVSAAATAVSLAGYSLLGRYAPSLRLLLDGWRSARALGSARPARRATASLAGVTGATGSASGFARAGILRNVAVRQNLVARGDAP